MSDNSYIPIEKDFYDLVEKPNYLKHILYGDSVTGENFILFKFQDENIQFLTLTELWELLIQNFEVQNIQNKEYIFFPPNTSFQIQNYNIKEDKIFYVTPKYFMRHKYSGVLYENYLTNEIKITTTINHSCVEVDIQNKEFLKQTPEKIQYLPILNVPGLRPPLRFALTYGFHTQHQVHGIFPRKQVCQEFFKEIRPHKICKKNKIQTDDCWVYDFEVPETHIFIINNVLVHNTDSLFLEIPKNPEKIEDKIKLVNKTASDINSLIVSYNKNYLLPRCGYSSDRNETKFKEEFVIDRMVMLDVKKSYAYRQLSSEAKIDEETNKLIDGKIFDHPMIEKKSGLGIKSDMINLTKDILDRLIDIALNTVMTPQSRYKLALTDLGNFKSLFEKALNEFDFQLIGTPVRWQKKQPIIQAMELYNRIVEKSFQYLTVGKLVYCQFNNLNKLKKYDFQFSLDKLNAIVIPSKFDKQKLKKALDDHDINFDREKQWENILNTTCRRFLKVFKDSALLNGVK